MRKEVGMAGKGDRISFVHDNTREVGTLESIQRLSNEAIVLTDDGHRHLVYFSEIEQPIERLPETELPSFESTGIKLGPPEPEDDATGSSR